MNLKYISSFAVLGIVAITATSVRGESEVSNNAQFACVNDNGVSVTVSELNGNSKPIFHWQGDLLNSLEVNATELCQDTAIRLNDYIAEKYSKDNPSSSQFLSFRADQELNLPMICATNNPEADCEAVLFTLSPTDKPVQIANNLLTDILDKDLQGNKTELESPARGVQSISYSISILDLIFGSKYLK